MAPDREAPEAAGSRRGARGRDPGQPVDQLRRPRRPLRRALRPADLDADPRDDVHADRPGSPPGSSPARPADLRRGIPLPGPSLALPALGRALALPDRGMAERSLGDREAA